MHRRRRIQQPTTEQLETRALLATITVTSAADTIADDGAVTLREALQAANTDQSVDGSTAGDGHDKIVFDPSVNGTIQIDSALQVLDSVTVVGNGAGNTMIRGIQTEDGFVLNGEVGRGYRLNIERVRLTNMKTAVWAQAATNSGEYYSQVAIRNSRIRGNYLGVLAATNLVVFNTEFYNNVGEQDSNNFGGGIASINGTASISGSRFVRNKSFSNGGGAIYADTEGLRIDGSLFLENKAPIGGAVYVPAGTRTLDVSNSTFVRNEARSGQGGAIYTGVDTTIESSTFVDNEAKQGGGAVFTEWRDLRVRNSVFAGNLARKGLAEDLAFDDRADLTEFQHNFLSSNRSSGLDANGGVADEDGNMIGSETEPIDAMLGALENHGGPTRTMLPLSGSPLLNAGMASELDNDQRGKLFPRKVGSAVDIGAAEYVDIVLRVTPTEPVLSEGSDDLTTTFDVTLLIDVGEAFDVNVLTVNGSAVVGSDFEAVDETLSFTGTAGETQQVQLTIVDDSDFETLEHLYFDFVGSLTDQVLGSTSREIFIESDELYGSAAGYGTLLVSSDDRGASASIDVVGEDLRVTLDGEENLFPASEVQDIRVIMRGGDNSLVMDQIITLPTDVTAGPGSDTITTAGGDDSVVGGDGDDSISLGEGTNRAWGGNGRDTIIGGSSANYLWGQNGSDLLDGGNGGSGLYGGRGRDTLLGGNGRDFMQGEAGSDYLDGGGGDDYLYGFYPVFDRQRVGRDGRDTLRGGDGRDIIWGGGAEKDNVRGGQGDDYVEAYGNIRGGSGDDTLIAVGESSSTLAGNSGHDTVTGSAGDDFLTGGTGHDVLLGREGNDSLVGMDGRDIVVGGIGGDTLIGSIEDDIMIAGSTDLTENGLRRTGLEWQADRDFEVRMANLTDGSGSSSRFNGEFFLLDSGENQNIFDDGAADFLRGEDGLDWFFANLSQDDIDGED